MLTHEDNETLCRVGPGTPMGTWMRLFWLPFYPADQLSPDGQPKRVNILGEDLVAFRDTDGKPGLVANACPHRRAPLMFGRNEECGLRCVYHGWKFDVEGRIMDLPAEPEASRLKERVRLKAYAYRERNGVLWAYMGEAQDDPPLLPQIEFNLVPAENVHISFRVQECNWLQALEGEIDSAHAPILHGRIDAKGAINDWVVALDLKPTFKCTERDYGVSIASRRNVGEAPRYWRVNQFVAPFWTLVPPQSKFPELSGHAWLPMDDEHTLCLMFSYTPASELYPRTRELLEQGHRGRETGHASVNCFEPQPATTPYADFWTKFATENGYQFDYESQQTTWLSGLPGLWIQDAACQSGLMPIYDRTQENLCVSDAGIAVTRRFLLNSVSALAVTGERSKGADIPATFMVRALSLTLPADEDWEVSSVEHMTARVGKDFGYTP